MKKSIETPGIELLKKSTLLITGATGMICSTIVEMLLDANINDDANIKLIIAGRSKERVEKRFSNYMEGKDFRFVEFDSLKPLQFDEYVDYIIHGASNANPGVYAVKPVETLIGNLNGTNSLLELAKSVKAKRMLYISSSEVYGRKEETSPFREDDYCFVDILNPRACYPSSKRAAETLCASYIDEYSVDCVIVRPGHIYGPQITEADNRATAQFTRNVLKGENIVLKSAGQQLRSYCYTEDCATAILTVLAKGNCGQAYNISNKNSIVSIRQIAEAFADYAGAKVVFENPTDFEAKGNNLMDNSSLDAAKLEGLGWKAKYSLEEGVKKTIDLMKKER